MNFYDDVEIVRLADGLVQATVAPHDGEQVDEVLRLCGFTLAPEPGSSSFYLLSPDLPTPQQQLAAGMAATLLDRLGYFVALAPELRSGRIEPGERRAAAARATSPTTVASPNAPVQQPPLPAPERPVGRSR
ncbi:hypothetical protein [Kitasatospora sp. LaBMicrA B282]|uniref:hypothetical protein n=1 Tax=Kitasatospora sp. LaBMicrA B282 TaxID=3420949 RepID=UPI003D1261AE